MIDRRGFLQSLAVGVALAALGGLDTILAADGGRFGKQPNVILIYVDDMGSVDLNCYGSKEILSPNLDQLASEGVRFTQYYSGSPVCSPSRATLMTGMYPRRAGLEGNAWGPGGLPNEKTTMAEVFKNAGYRTGLFGKWHLGDTLEVSPNAQGFDEFFGHKVGCIDNYSHYFYWAGPNKHDLWRNEQEVFEPGSYFPDLIVREARQFMTERATKKDSPFFLYLAFNMPHYPMQAEQEDVAKYGHVTDPKRKRYCAFVTSLDRRIGQVIDIVNNLGMRDNTIIMFASDNGHSLEERAFGGGGSAGPYRGHKFTLWEGGIRLPSIISWPDKLPRGEVRDQWVGAVDWMATLPKWCGITSLEDIDGLDITKVIKSADAQSPHEVMHWTFNKNWAVREKNWKLVREGDELFLSDMDKDTSEQNNIAKDHPKIVERLTKMHEEWYAATAVRK